MLNGKTLGGYTLDHPLGRGNFSTVFEAVDDATGGRFAVKVLKPAADARDRFDFENEAVLLRQLNLCEGVISFVDGGTDDIEVFDAAGAAMPFPFPYLVMPLATGCVAELVEDPVGRVNWNWIERLQVFRGVLTALRQMHAHGVVHRDLKCANCLMVMSVAGGGFRIRLNDLGRAKDLSLPATLPMEEYVAGRGDLRFAPPEFLYLQGGVRAEDFLAADYYGLGSMLVELTTGQPMTALAIPEIMRVLHESQADYLAGRRRDLSALVLRYRSVVADILTEMPVLIRPDAAIVLNSLCHPVPAQRLIRAPFSKDRLSPDGLAWVLRRTDIMIHRLEIEARVQRRAARQGRMSA